MTPTRTRRWLRAVVALSVVTVVVGFVVFREDPKDVPRLVILEKKDLGGSQHVYFRLDAPRSQDVLLFGMHTLNPATKVRRKPMLEGVEGAPDEILLLAQPPESTAPPVFKMKAGQSVEFRVAPPVDNVWRLRCDVLTEASGVRGVLTRLRMCWQRRSLTPLWRSNTQVEYWGLVESEPITNTPSRPLGHPRP